MSSSSSIPPKTTVTTTLMAITVGVFIAQVVAGLDASIGEWGMAPARIARENAWWLLLTATFMHASVLHLLFNVAVLAAIGSSLERALGHGRYLAVYLLSGLGGAVASFWLSPANVISVGASGAIFGLMGGLLAASVRAGVSPRQAAVVIAINLAIGFVLPGIDWRAHLGGLAAGMASTALLLPGNAGPRTQRLPSLAGLLVVMLTLVGVCVVRYMQLTGSPGNS